MYICNLLKSMQHWLHIRSVMYNVQSSALCAVAKCSMFNVFHCAMFDVKCEMFNVQSSAYNVEEIIKGLVVQLRGSSGDDGSICASTVQAVTWGTTVTGAGFHFEQVLPHVPSSSHNSTSPSTFHNSISPSTFHNSTSTSTSHNSASPSTSHNSTSPCAKFCHNSTSPSTSTVLLSQSPYGMLAI